MPLLDDPTKTQEESAEEQERARRFIDFLEASPEPFHVVAKVKKLLEAQGYTELSERDLWGEGGLVKKGGKYFYIRNSSSIVVFAVGGSCVASRLGFKVIGAHTDSPALKIKPRSKRAAGAGGVTQLGVETYGGGLWHTWFDRDLSAAGKVITVRRDEGGKESFCQELVDLEEPLLRVPNLAIHLQSAKEREAFAVNKEDHLVPLLCSAVADSLGKSDNAKGAKHHGSGGGWSAGHEPVLLELIAKKLGLSAPTSIADFELTLYDTQRAAVGGARHEFLSGARLDNLASCFVAVEALAAHTGDEAAFGADGDVSMVALFDHEEVGSTSAAGAGSPIMRDAVERICGALAWQSQGGAPTGAATNSEVFKAALERSMILSVDMAHAVHPNYANKHEKHHGPAINAGPVIKTNSNQRYATNGITGFLTREIGRRANVPVQEFAVRNDCPCGSTIGPVIAANTGIRAVDLGMPQLSMHSIRETMGVADLTLAHRLFAAFFAHFREVDDALVL